jgi:hypothetical protein
MRFHHASLLLALLIAAASAQDPTDPGPAAKPDYAALKAEFDAAMKEYSVKVRAASAEERQELVKNAPPRQFLDRFAAGAGEYAGQPEAVPFLVWLAQNDRAKAREHMTTLMEKHLRHAGLQPAIAMLGRMHAQLGKENVLRWLGELARREDDPETAAKALLTRAQMFTGTTAGTSTDAERAGAVADLKRARELAQDERTKGECTDLITGQEKFGVGVKAPEIEGDDVDGVAFKLYDYRGKVILLDFWGFW